MKIRHGHGLKWDPSSIHAREPNFDPEVIDTDIKTYIQHESIDVVAFGLLLKVAYTFLFRTSKGIGTNENADNDCFTLGKSNIQVSGNKVEIKSIYGKYANYHLQFQVAKNIANAFKRLINETHGDNFFGSLKPVLSAYLLVRFSINIPAARRAAMCSHLSSLVAKFPLETSTDLTSINLNEYMKRLCPLVQHITGGYLSTNTLHNNYISEVLKEEIKRYISCGESLILYKQFKTLPKYTDLLHYKFSSDQ